MLSTTVLKTQPDGTLASLAAAGSEPAFEAIVHRYRRPLLGYCRRLRLSDVRSEDVVQQTFLNAWGSLRDGTEVRELRPWLYRITHNQIVTLLRAAGPAEASLSEVPDVCGSIDVYERQTRLRETLSAVAALPELQREALLATAVDGLSYEQVALALNTSADAVRGLVYRARNTLRAGVAVLSPGPIILWAANQAGSVGSASMQQWLTEAGAGGGSIGLSAAAIKGALVVASSAAVSGGVGVGISQHLLSSGASTRPTATQSHAGSSASAVTSASQRVAHSLSAAVHAAQASPQASAAAQRLAGLGIHRSVPATLRHGSSTVWTATAVTTSAASAANTATTSRISAGAPSTSVRGRGSTPASPTGTMQTAPAMRAQSGMQAPMMSAASTSQGSGAPSSSSSGTPQSGTRQPTSASTTTTPATATTTTTGTTPMTSTASSATTSTTSGTTPTATPSSATPLSATPSTGSAQASPGIGGTMNTGRTLPGRE